MTTDHQWMIDARFGLFIHFGLYSNGARHEWVKSLELLTDDQYQPYFDHWDPDLCDPVGWADMAVDAGMKYAVLTTKHHEGFCLWDTALTDYKSTNTPFGRDVVGEFVEAFRSAGLRVGLYHSLLDWHHEHYTIDANHPRRHDVDAYAVNADRDMAVYREFLLGQVTELLTDYGRIDYLFYDFSFPGDPYRHIPGSYPDFAGKGRLDWDSDRIMQVSRELQPGVVINDRLDLPGDFLTPEQHQPVDVPMRDGEPVMWEGCHTINGTWGYHRDNRQFLAADTLVRLLVDSVSKGGNLLLNVGPTGRGTIDDVSKDTLATIGEWVRLHGRSVFGAGPSYYTPPADARYTQRGDRLYLHLFAWPVNLVHLPGLAGKVSYAQLLHDGSEIPIRSINPVEPGDSVTPFGLPDDCLTLMVPRPTPDIAVPVIELFLNGDHDDPADE